MMADLRARQQQGSRTVVARHPKRIQSPRTRKD
jgi:hypothetical protein